MGKKGDKATSAGDEAAVQYLTQLSAIEGVTSKKMFGGHGIFQDGKMFGMVDSKGGLAFKATEATVARYEAAGHQKKKNAPLFRTR